MRSAFGTLTSLRRRRRTWLWLILVRVSPATRSDHRAGKCRSATKPPHERPVPPGFCHIDAHPLYFPTVMIRSALCANTRRLTSQTANLSLTRRISLKSDGYPVDMAFYPDFFSLEEQRVLLSASLQKLDMTESRKVRRRQKEFISSRARFCSS